MQTRDFSIVERKYYRYVNNELSDILALLRPSAELDFRTIGLKS